VNLEGFLAQGLNQVSSFTLGIALVLFVICFIGEAFVISIPALFETTWLAAGYQLSAGVLRIPDLIGLMLVSQLGRQAGALILYALSRSGTRFFSKFIARRLPKDLPAEHDGFANKLLRGIDSISPFGVAIGRLLFLRIPLTLLLGARRKLKTLVLGIAISSTIYEAVYIGVGVFVRTIHVPPSGYLVLYFAGGLAVLYGMYSGIRFLVRRKKGGTGCKSPSPSV
jgi:membrane-associated protein